MKVCFSNQLPVQNALSDLKPQRPVLNASGSTNVQNLPTVNYPEVSFGRIKKRYILPLLFLFSLILLIDNAPKEKGSIYKTTENLRELYLSKYPMPKTAEDIENLSPQARFHSLILNFSNNLLENKSALWQDIKENLPKILEKEEVKEDPYTYEMIAQVLSLKGEDCSYPNDACHIFNVLTKYYENHQKQSSTTK